MGQPGNAGKTIVYVILPKWVEAYRHGVCCPLRGLMLRGPRSETLQNSNENSFKMRGLGMKRK